MIDLRQLSVSYGADEVLHSLDLHIAAGECVLVTGPSGCGKSTLARVLCGLIPHAIPAGMSGQAQVAGLDVTAVPLPEISERVGMVFQNPASQLFHLRVADEVAFGPHNLGLDSAEVEARVIWALESVGLLDLRQARPADLSGGQKQRLAIAAAIAMRPQVLVLDEPTASLDVPGTQAVVEILKRLKAGGVTIVIIEHRLAEMSGVAERVILMEDGRITAQGSPALLQDRQLLRRLGMRRPVDSPIVQWHELLLAGQEDAAPGAPLLELCGVSAGYNGHAVLEEIDLALYPGEFTALVGDNGAGKSTLALVAAGLLKPSQGRVEYWNGQGRLPGSHPTRRAPRPGLDISLLFQNPEDQIFTDSVDEEVAFGPRNYACFDPDRHEQILSQADLLGLRQRRPTQISVGQQQRTALSASLALFPRLLILDEPTLGQDWGHLQRLMDFLAGLNRQGAAILLITHDYKLVHHYAQRIILMDRGRITLDGRLRFPKMEESA